MLTIYDTQLRWIFIDDGQIQITFCISDILALSAHAMLTSTDIDFFLNI